MSQEDLHIFIPVLPIICSSAVQSFAYKPMQRLNPTVMYVYTPYMICHFRLDVWCSCCVMFASCHAVFMSRPQPHNSEIPHNRQLDISEGARRYIQEFVGMLFYIVPVSHKLLKEEHILNSCYFYISHIY